MKIEDEEEKKTAPTHKMTVTAKTVSIIIFNVIFFGIVAGGLMLVSGKFIFELLGVNYWAAKSKDDGSL